MKPERKPVNVVMLPTEEQSTAVICKFDASDKLIKFSGNISSNLPFKRYHLYILSDEEIKKGDWYYVPNQLIGHEHISNEFNDKHTLDSISVKKIIATTNPELNVKTIYREGTKLVKDELWDIPKISDDFIKEYIREWNNGNIIKDVDIETEYNILYPMVQDNNIKIKTNSNNEVIIL